MPSTTDSTNSCIFQRDSVWSEFGINRTQLAFTVNEQSKDQQHEHGVEDQPCTYAAGHREVSELGALNWLPLSVCFSSGSSIGSDAVSLPGDRSNGGQSNDHLKS